MCKRVGFRVTGSYGFDLQLSELAKVDLGKEQFPSVIASTFDNTIAKIIAEVCRRLRENEHLNRVSLSDGTFPNVYLLAMEAFRRQVVMRINPSITERSHVPGDPRQSA